MECLQDRKYPNPTSASAIARTLRVYKDERERHQQEREINLYKNGCTHQWEGDDESDNQVQHVGEDESHQREGEHYEGG